MTFGGTRRLQDVGPTTVSASTVLPAAASTIVADTSVDGTAGFEGSAATQLTNALTLKAADVQAHLNTIPILNGNVTVTGNDGGPFSIAFGGALDKTNVQPLTLRVTALRLPCRRSARRSKAIPRPTR